jgi:hypothetical protein
MEFIPCIFSCLTWLCNNPSLLRLSIDQICDIKMKMKDQNISVLNDLNALVVNIKKYRKKDRKIILKLVINFLEQNISLNNSNANIDEIKEEI